MSHRCFKSITHNVYIILITKNNFIHCICLDQLETIKHKKILKLVWLHKFQSQSNKVQSKLITINFVGINVLHIYSHNKINAFNMHRFIRFYLLDKMEGGNLMTHLSDMAKNIHYFSIKRLNKLATL